MDLKYMLWVVCLVLGVAAISDAQVNKSSLSGTLTDSSGAVVPGAQVTLREVQTGTSYQTTSNRDGAYDFSALTLGEYTLTVVRVGFKTFVQLGLLINAGDNKRIDVSLEVGNTTQRVQVTGAAPVLETEEATYSDTMATSTLSELPIELTGIKRDPMGFLNTMPGYQTSDAINGSQESYTQAIVNGAPASINPGSQANMTNDFSVEGLAEFKVVDDATADMGNSPADVISFVTKSGTNQFHGALYEYLLNTDLNSRSFFANAVPKDIQNEFGFTVGGPVVIPRIYNGKDKTFFFFNYGQSRYLFGTTPSFYTVPTGADQGGNFLPIEGAQVGTDLLGRPVYQNEIYNPTTTRTVTQGAVDPVTGLTATGSGTIRDPFSGNAIPAAAFSSFSKKFQSIYPTPTNSSLANNYLGAGGSGVQVNPYYSVQIDQYAGQNHFSGLYWRDHYVSGPPLPLPAIFAIRNDVGFDGHSGRFNWTRTFGPELVNDFSFGLDRNLIIWALPAI